MVESSARFPKNVIDEFDHQIIRYIEEHTSAEDFALLIRGGVPVVIPDPDPIDPVSIAESNYVAAIESSHDAHSPIDVDVAFDSYHINAMDTVAEMGGNKEQINAVSVLYLGLVEAWKDKQHDVEEERRLSRGPTSRELALSKRIAKQGKWIDLGEGEWTWRWHGMGYAHYVDTKKSYGNNSLDRYDVENERYQDWREARAIALSTEAVPRLIADGYLNEQGVLSEEDEDPYVDVVNMLVPPMQDIKLVDYVEAVHDPKGPDSKLIVSKHNPESVKVAIDMVYRKVRVRGETGTVHLGMYDEVDKGLAIQALRDGYLNRVNSNKPVTTKARMLAEDLVLKELRFAKKHAGMPEEGKIYRLTGGTDESSIYTGSSWEDSEVTDPSKERSARLVKEYESVLSDVYNAISDLENGEHPETNIPEGLDRLAEIAQNDDIAAWTGSSFNGWNRYESVKRDYEQAVSRIAAQSDADAALRVRLKEYISDAEKMLREEWSDYDDAGIEDEIRRTQSILDQLGEISTYDPEAERRKELAENLNRRLNRTVIAERDGRTVAPAQQMSPEPEPEDFMERFTSGLRSLLTD